MLKIKESSPESDDPLLDEDDAIYCPQLGEIKLVEGADVPIIKISYMDYMIDVSIG